MNNQHEKEFFSIFQESFNELYTLRSLITVIRCLCEDKEFKGEYYGLEKNEIQKLSAERNDYINLLYILVDKTANIINLNLELERQIAKELYENTNDCRRHITTECTANQSSETESC